MKNFFESIKDFIYDSVDYLIMVSIIGIIVLVIGWRINILFAEKPLNEPIATFDEIENIANKDNDIKNLTTQDDVSATSNEDNNNSSDMATNEKTINIVIPDGAFPSTIGDILEDSGLVSSKTDFISKSQEMNLDTKLRSGNYDIEVGTSLESIVKMIAK